MKTLLSEGHVVAKMRKEGHFNFDSISRGPHKITIKDCEDYFAYCKVLFECQKYDSKLSYQLWGLEVKGHACYDDSTLKIPSFGAESIVLIKKVQLRSVPTSYNMSR